MAFLSSQRVLGARAFRALSSPLLRSPTSTAGTAIRGKSLSGLASSRASLTSNERPVRGGRSKDELAAAKKFRLAPSDFAFLWRECKRCFYLKSYGSLYRPRAPFPSVFNQIDLAMKDFFSGKRTESIFPEMPPGEFLCEAEDAWVESELIDLGRQSLVYIRGKIDCLCMNDDGSYSIIDFKTSDSTRYLDLYSRQLHAYALALEFPSENSELEKGEVTNMGLVVYRPNSFGLSKESAQKKKAGPVANLSGNCSYHAIQKDLTKFVQFLGEIVDTLEGELPKPTPDCPCCSYLRKAIDLGYSEF